MGIFTFHTTRIEIKDGDGFPLSNILGICFIIAVLCLTAGMESISMKREYYVVVLFFGASHKFFLCGVFVLLTIGYTCPSTHAAMMPIIIPFFTHIYQCNCVYFHVEIERRRRGIIV